MVLLELLFFTEILRATKDLYCPWAAQKLYLEVREGPK